MTVSGEPCRFHTLLPCAPVRMPMLPGGQMIPARGRRGMVPYPERQPTERESPTPPPSKRTELSLLGDLTGDTKNLVSCIWEQCQGELHSFPQITPLRSPQDHQHSRACHRGRANRQVEWEARAVQVNKGKSHFALPALHPRALEREGRRNTGPRGPGLSLCRGRQGDKIYTESEIQELNWAAFNHSEEPECPRISRGGNPERVWLKEVPNKLAVFVFFSSPVFS